MFFLSNTPCRTKCLEHRKDSRTVKLDGQVASFDQYVILLESPALHLVYKHAIFSIVPSRDFKLPPELEPKPEPAPESKPKEARRGGPKRTAVQIRKKR